MSTESHGQPSRPATQAASAPPPSTPTPSTPSASTPSPTGATGTPRSAPPVGPAGLRAQVESLSRRNDGLVRTLEAAREQLVTLKQQVEALATPPSSYGVLLCVHDDGTVDVLASGRRMRVQVSPVIDVADLKTGRDVRLNEALAVVDVAGYERHGQVVVVHETLDDERLVVVVHGEEQRVVRRAEPLLGAALRQGDSVLLETRTGFAYEVIPKAEVEDLVLEEVPDISYDDIGGLAGQIEQIRDSVELPYLHPELFREHSLRPPKGVLLYGPPGCGKTLIAKAVAASLARQSAQLEGRSDSTSYFLNIKGPELLNKYVGETERQIRLIFARAREHASSGAPVVVFFDEMDSLFRTRGSGLSSDVETTIVPQLLAEIDGVERLDNVIVIGASNREDMIDPAILRPGRLDAKIKIERPDEGSARDIFGKYLTADLPLHADELAAADGDPARAVHAMTQATVARMYDRGVHNRFLEVSYADGEREVLHYADFASGAMIQNVVDRAKRSAIKDLLATGERGLRTRHLLEACVAEFAENEDMPGTSSPEEWARISGRRGQRVVGIRRVHPDAGPGDPGQAAGERRGIADVEPSGTYL
ncbi:proteasome-associated ATPase [Kineosphaera limosa]|uniref:AAA ATPase forming ring-shaped complexes n=1 Tax=Kineosphaera limosa NBRC 100340 TaxID=1184609 RepID=K6WL60_9MICO|nr:proteasome ATPase [Kineosphaera limosa]NYE03209.1 proteasome-associated ATPase [Kineosphaera limosa]GAB94546.1 ATPase ARC [Kineosphaera limosa NBRC 100340]